MGKWRSYGFKERHSFDANSERPGNRPAGKTDRTSPRWNLWTAVQKEPRLNRHPADEPRSKPKYDLLRSGRPAGVSHHSQTTEDIWLLRKPLEKVQLPRSLPRNAARPERRRRLS